MNNKPEIIRGLERQKLDSLFSNQLWKLIMDAWRSNYA